MVTRPNFVLRDLKIQSSFSPATPHSPKSPGSTAESVRPPLARRAVLPARCALPVKHTNIHYMLVRAVSQSDRNNRNQHQTRHSCGVGRKRSKKAADWSEDAVEASKASAFLFSSGSDKTFKASAFMSGSTGSLLRISCSAFSAPGSQAGCGRRRILFILWLVKPAVR